MASKLQRTPPSKSNTPTRFVTETESIALSDEILDTKLAKKCPTTRKRAAAVASEEKCDYATFKDEMRKLMLDMVKSQNGRLDKIESHLSAVVAQVEAHVKEIKSNVDQSNKDMEKSMSFMSDQLKSFEDKYGNFASERDLLVRQVAIFEEKLENMERYSLKTSIEIRNVPKKSNETKDSLLKTFQNLVKVLDVPFEKSEIKDMFRLPAKKDSNKPTIVVEFINMWSKTCLLNALKKYKRSRSDQLNTKNLGLDGVALPVYISERMTAKARRLHFLARELAKTEKYAHCWVLNGKVFLRKLDGAPIVAVKNEDHLHSLRTQNSTA